MANYRNIHVKMWSDPKFESLSLTAKLLFVYLLTNPYRNESGLYPISRKKISFETNIENLLPPIQDLIKNGLIEYDDSCQMVWVRNAIKYQGLNSNCIKSITSDLDKCSSITLKNKFAEYYKDYKGLQTLCNGLLMVSKNPSIGIGLGIGLGIGIEERPFFEKAIPVSLRVKEGFVEAWKQWKYLNDDRGTELLPAMVKLQLAYLTEQPDPVKLLEQATANNWKGLIYDKKTNGHKPEIKPDPSRYETSDVAKDIERRKQLVREGKSIE